MGTRSKGGYTAWTTIREIAILESRFKPPKEFAPVKLLVLTGKRHRRYRVRTSQSLPGKN